MDLQNIFKKQNYNNQFSIGMFYMFAWIDLVPFVYKYLTRMVMGRVYCDWSKKYRSQEGKKHSCWHLYAQCEWILMLFLTTINCPPIDLFVKKVCYCFSNHTFFKLILFFIALYALECAIKSGNDFSSWLSYF